MSGSRISDMTPLPSLPASGATVPIVKTGQKTNYGYDLAADLAGRPTLAQLAAADMGSSLLAYLPAPTGISAANLQSALQLTLPLIPEFFGSAGGKSNGPAAAVGSDDTTAIKALVAFINANPQYTPDFGGKFWTVSDEIKLVMTADLVSGATVRRPAQRAFGGTFVQSATSAPLTRILTINAPGVHLAGLWGAIGNGDPLNCNTIAYASRGADYGIYLVDSYGIKIDGWYAANLKRYGFHEATEDFAHLGDQTNGLGNNIGIDVGPGQGFNCGSAAGQANASRLTYTISAVTYNGASAGPTQTTTVAFVETLDSKIQVRDEFTYNRILGTYAVSSITSGSKNVSVPNTTGMLVGQLITGTGIPTNATITGVTSTTTITISANATATNASVTLTTIKREAYTIKTVVDANTLEFYYWLPSTAAAAQTMDSAHGGFLHIQGSNSGTSRFGNINGIRAGVGCKDSGLYGCNVGLVHVESSGIGRVLGAPTVAYGGSTAGIHVESTYLALVNRNTTPTGHTIGPMSANGVGILPGSAGWYSQVYHQRPRYSSDNFAFYGAAGVILPDGNGALVQNEAGPSAYEAAITAITVSNRPHERFYRAAFSTASTPTVTLNWHEGYNENWSGKNWMGFELQGAQAGRNAMSQVTVQLDSSLTNAGWTLNGGAVALVYTGMKGPCRGTAIVDVKNKNFRFALEAPEPQALQGTTTAPSGNGTITLNAGTSKKVLIVDTPISAARAVTLQTTNAIDGDSFTIVRTANATGAFPLNVGTGPLIAMTPATETVVTYDGTAALWRVTSYGPLAKAATSSATYVAPAGGTTVDTEGRAALAQLAADLADMKAKQQAAGLMT